MRERHIPGYRPGKAIFHELAGNRYLSAFSKEEISGSTVVAGGSGTPGEPVGHEEPRVG